MRLFGEVHSGENENTRNFQDLGDYIVFCCIKCIRYELLVVNWMIMVYKPRTQVSRFKMFKGEITMSLFLF